MLRVNDDSDELFRKAAEHYPLETGAPDWEAVKSKMSGWTEEETILPPARDKKRFMIVLLICAGAFLLTPMAVVDLLDHDLSEGKIRNKDAHSSKDVSVKNELPALPQNNPESVEDLLPVSSMAARKMNSPIAATKEIHANEPVATHHSSRTKSTKHRTEISIAQPQVENEFVSDQIKPKEKSISPVYEINIPKQTDNSKEVLVAANKPVEENKDSKKEDIPSIKVEPEPQSPEEKKTIKRNRRFYAGIIGGLDVSMIKMQEVKKVGYSAGILLGYRLNKRVSVESGILWDKKNYSTDGKYFNPKNIYLPNYSTILHADGDCNMFELPVNIRYNLFPKTSSNFYVVAGTSSYFMKKENYVYKIKHYNNIYDRAYTYRNSSSSLFSVVNLAAGYEKTLGGSMMFRAEPYIKLPVNKVGIGNMSLQSAGVNVGLTKSF